MTPERLTLDAAAETLFADGDTRTISGVAIPLGSTAVKGGRTWRFARGSVRFPSRVPLLAHHDTTRPLGRLVSSAWSDEGLRVKFAVSRTTAGDEALQLANDGVLGLSVGLDVPMGGAKQVGEELHVSRATAVEVSLTPIPAFAGSVIDHVALTSDTPEGTAMPDAAIEIGAPPPVTLNLDAEALGRTIAAALQPAMPTGDGPTPQPVPQTVTTVREELPYRFDGRGGRFGFVADMRDAAQGNPEANNRLEQALAEIFVQQSNVTGLNPAVQRPDLYVDRLRYVSRPLSDAVSTGTIADSRPFIFPKFGTSGTLVAPHVEGVEPSLASFTATSATVTPGALSGKAEITREVWDAGGSPAVDQLVFQEMIYASVKAAEARVAAALDAVTPGGTIAVVGTNDSAVDDLVAALIALQFEEGGGSRFDSLVLAANLYTALAVAKDADGRRLLPMVNAQNADGTASASFGGLQIGNVTAVPAWGLGTNSYLFPRGSVWQWLSTPSKLVFDIQVKSVYIGFWQYAAEAITRDSDIRRITYAAS